MLKSEPHKRNTMKISSVIVFIVVILSVQIFKVVRVRATNENTSNSNALSKKNNLPKLSESPKLDTKTEGSLKLKKRTKLDDISKTNDDDKPSFEAIVPDDRIAHLPKSLRRDTFKPDGLSKPKNSWNFS